MVSLSWSAVEPVLRPMIKTVKVRVQLEHKLSCSSRVSARSHSLAEVILQYAHKPLVEIQFFITFGSIPRSPAEPFVIMCTWPSGCGRWQRRQGKNIIGLTLVVQWANTPKDGQSCMLKWK